MLLKKALEEFELHLWRKWREHEQNPTSESLTFNELDYLQFIEKNETVRLTDLACGLGITKASASTMVSKLEKRGLVMRHSDDKDGRTSQLMLSEKGEQLKHSELQRYDEITNLLQNNLSQQDYLALQQLLAKTCSILTLQNKK